MFAEEKKFKTFDRRFVAKKNWGQKNLGKIMTCKNFFGSKIVWLKIFWSKTILSQKCFGLKEFGSFKIIADRFLNKTNLGKILGAERFGCKEVVVAFMLELSKIISG